MEKKIKKTHSFVAVISWFVMPTLYYNFGCICHCLDYLFYLSFEYSQICLHNSRILRRDNNIHQHNFHNRLYNFINSGASKCGQICT